jgi:hypothetical protein
LAIAGLAVANALYILEISSTFVVTQAFIKKIDKNTLPKRQSGNFNRW